MFLNNKTIYDDVRGEDIDFSGNLTITGYVCDSSHVEAINATTGAVFNSSSVTAKKNAKTGSVGTDSSVEAGKDAIIDGCVSGYNALVQAKRNAVIKESVCGSNASVQAEGKVIINEHLFNNTSATAKSIHVKGGTENASIICQELKAGTIKDTTIAKAHTKNNGVPSGVFTVYKITDEISGKQLEEQKSTTINIDDSKQLAESGLEKDFIERLQKYRKTYQEENFKNEWGFLFTPFQHQKQR